MEIDPVIAFRYAGHPEAPVMISGRGRHIEKFREKRKGKMWKKRMDPGRAKIFQR
jgi:hypothetical protein